MSYKSLRGLSLIYRQSRRGACDSRLGTVVSMRPALLLCWAIALFFLFTAVEAWADGAGRFSHVEGKVDVLRKGKFPAVIAEVGSPVFTDDIIRTKSDSKAEITFNDGNVVRIAERSRINISEYITGSRASISLPIGKVEAIVTKARRVSASPEANRFEIKTPTAVAGVRGTDFFVSYDGNITEVFVKEGEVVVHNLKFPDAPIIITTGNLATVEPHKPPEPPKPAAPEKIRQYEKEVTPEKKTETKPDTAGAASKTSGQELKKFIGCP